MNKILVIIVSVIMVALIIVGIINKDSRKTNDAAEKDENGRYLTIINDTEQIINEVHVTVGNGTEIEDMKQINPDERSFSMIDKFFNGD